MKKCAACLQQKPYDEFSADHRKSDGKRSRCKSCVKSDRRDNRDRDRISHSKWKEKHPEIYRGYKAAVYSISASDYNRIFEAQDGKCAICGTHQSKLSKSLAIDHDHDTGVVRGLLCTKCNIAIGLMNDDCDNLTNAILYLKTFVR